MKEKKRVPVSERAVIDRVNRRLAESEQTLKICRKGPWLDELGRYFVLSTATDEVLRSRIKLSDYAQAIGALEPWEFIVNEKGGAA